MQLSSTGRCWTYKRPSTDADGRGRLAHRAVGGSDNGVGVQQSTSTEVGATLRQADNVGELSRQSLGSADDLDVDVAVGGILCRDGRRHGGGGHEKRSDEGNDRLHCADLGNQNLGSG